MNITKLELCNRVSQRFETRSAGDLKPIFEAFLDEILEVLSEGERIEIRGFGCFRTKLRQKRQGRNPRTGETVQIPAYTAPTFKFSKDAQKGFDVKLDKKKKKSTPKKTPKATVPKTAAPKAVAPKVEKPKKTDTVPEIKQASTSAPAVSAETFSPI